MNKFTKIILSVVAGMLCGPDTGHAQTLASTRPKKNADFEQNLRRPNAEVVLSGKITDKADGQDIPGANVLLKGTNICTSTDNDGKFSLRIPAANGTLVISFIGYVTQETEIKSRVTFDIALAANTTMLNEVVVTALGIKPNPFLHKTCTRCPRRLDQSRPHGRHQHGGCPIAR